MTERERRFIKTKDTLNTFFVLKYKNQGYFCKSINFFDTIFEKNGVSCEAREALKQGDTLILDGCMHTLLFRGTINDCVDKEKLLSEIFKENPDIETDCVIEQLNDSFNMSIMHSENIVDDHEDNASKLSKNVKLSDAVLIGLHNSDSDDCQDNMSSQQLSLIRTKNKADNEAKKLKLGLSYSVPKATVNKPTSTASRPLQNSRKLNEQNSNASTTSAIENGISSARMSSSSSTDSQAMLALLQSMDKRLKRVEHHLIRSKTVEFRLKDTYENTQYSTFDNMSVFYVDDLDKQAPTYFAKDFISRRYGPLYLQNFLFDSKRGGLSSKEAASEEVVKEVKDLVYSLFTNVVWARVVNYLNQSARTSKFHRKRKE